MNATLVGRCRWTVLALGLWAAAVPSRAQSAPGPDPETRFTIGMTHLREGRLDMALDELKRAAKDDPKSPYFQKGLGMVHMQRREFDKAVEAYRKALELNPYYTDVRNDLGTALLSAGKRGEGKKELLTAFNDPTYNTPEVAARNLGHAYYEERNYAEALQWFRTATQRNPRYTDAWLGAADVLVVTGQLDEAATQLEAARKQLPDALAVTLAFGEACLKAGRFGEARSALEEVARKEPGGALGRRAVELLKGFPK